ncbi:TPA: hypothetical protein ACXIOL_002232 [Neisseria meningitidis]
MNKNERDFFYISNSDLDKLSESYPDRPLSYVFYCYLKETGLLKNFSMDKCHKFFNRINFNESCFEIKFKDDSFFIIGNGKIDVSDSNNFFSVSFEC